MGIGPFRYDIGPASGMQRSVCSVSSGIKLQFEKLFRERLVGPR